jgi:hypothetical protein
MPIVKLDLDIDTYERLARSAIRELRPVHWQAEVLLRQALGLPFPYPPDMEAPTDKAAAKVSEL